MQTVEFLRQMEEALELPQESLAAADELEVLEGWDSLAVVTFMAFVDEQFGLVLSPREIEKCKTVADLLKLLGDRFDG